MPFRIDIDRGACIGSGNCTRITEGGFKLDDEDVAYVADASKLTDEKLEEAEASCPTGAIALHDE
jgi:ferredoxin